jgi:hypothetical protein
VLAAAAVPVGTVVPAAPDVAGGSVVAAGVVVPDAAAAAPAVPGRAVVAVRGPVHVAAPGGPGVAVPGTAVVPATGTTGTAAPAAPETRCAVVDERLAELSGLADDGGTVWAVADGGRRTRLLALDPATCEVVDERTADIDPYDAEDLARGPDRALWVGDVGDNSRVRDTVAVIVLPARGPARLHRLTYPDGPHDAEALLVDPEGRPVVVTKEAGRPAGVYRTAAPPDGTGPTPLVRVGEVALPGSTTEGGPLGGFGTRTVTGAAQSADGTVVAVRTYTDAWLFPAPSGDPVTAFESAPVQVPLPGEPQGEAIAFTGDGALLSGSETRSGVYGELRAVPGAAALAAASVVPSADAVPVPPAAAPEPQTPPEWWPAAIGGGAAVLLLGAVAGALAVRARRR